MDATIYDVDGKCTQESIYRIGKRAQGCFGTDQSPIFTRRNI